MIQTRPCRSPRPPPGICAFPLPDGGDRHASHSGSETASTACRGNATAGRAAVLELSAEPAGNHVLHDSGCPDERA
jgi:hypothetical protein